MVANPNKRKRPSKSNKGKEAASIQESANPTTADLMASALEFRDDQSILFEADTGMKDPTTLTTAIDGEEDPMVDPSNNSDALNQYILDAAAAAAIAATEGLYPPRSMPMMLDDNEGLGGDGGSVGGKLSTEPVDLAPGLLSPTDEHPGFLDVSSLDEHGFRSTEDSGLTSGLGDANHAVAPMVTTEGDADTVTEDPSHSHDHAGQLANSENNEEGHPEEDHKADQNGGNTHIAEDLQGANSHDEADGEDHTNGGHDGGGGSGGGGGGDDDDDEDDDDLDDGTSATKKTRGRRGRHSTVKNSVTSEEWMRIRRENHKEVERRRRETINAGIEELVLLIPNPPKNKGRILRHAAEYIRLLKQSEATNVEKWTLEKLLTEQAINELSAQVDMLKAQNEDLRNQLDSLNHPHKKLKE